MDFGITFGPRGAAGRPEGLTARAQQADRLGFSYLGIPDHIIFPKQSSSRYPYNVDGKHPSIGTGYCLDQLTCLSFIAALTNNIRLLTSVMVVPHRHPVLAAKTLGSIDVLSKGRLTVGIGVGWLAEEIAALGGPPYNKRGAASDAYIAAFRELWTSDDPRGDGTYVNLDGLVFEPKPVQKGGPPIWVGGEGEAARRRAGRIGNGWFPTLRNPRESLDPKSFATALADVHRHAEAAGRDPSTIDVAVYANSMSLGEAQKSADGSRVSFTGSASEIAEDAYAFARVGARHIIVGFESADLQRSLDLTEAFAKDVMAKVV